MTTARDIVIYQGQAFALSLPYAGAPGRGQRTHIRTADETATVIQILTHNGDANARVIYNDSTQTLDYTIGASVSALWRVGANRVEWVFDTEDYDLSDVDDVDIPFRGKAIVYGNRTRESDVTPSDQMPSGDGRYVRFDTDAQGLSDAQKLAARTNIGAGTGTGGSGTGDVVGPASATDDRIAAFDGTTGKLIKQGTVTATAVASHIGSTSNPHSVTAAQVGADPAGTAAGAVSTHNSVATAHGISAFGATLVDDADASTARTTLGLGTAATSASGDFAAASHAHAASAITSGTLAHERGGLEADVSAYSGLVKITGGATSAVTVTAAGEALLDDADASAQRTTLGLGTAATTDATAYATAAQGTDDRTASGLRSATTVVAVSSATAPSSGQVLTATSSTAATWQTPSGGGGSSNTIRIEAGELIPRVTAGAGIAGAETTTNDINRDVLAFDPATTEGAHKWIRWPAGYTGVLCQSVAWESDTGGTASAGVRWEISMRCFADGDALDQAPGTAQGITDLLDAVGDVMVSGSSSAITPAGTAADNALTLVQIVRNPSHADDGLAVDAWLHDFVLEFSA